MRGEIPFDRLRTCFAALRMTDEWAIFKVEEVREK